MCCCWVVVHVSLCVSASLLSPCCLQLVALLPTNEAFLRRKPSTPLVCCCVSLRFIEFKTAFKECKDSFDVIINCVSAKIDFGGMMGMLSHDGVVVQVSSSSNGCK